MSLFKEFFAAPSYPDEESSRRAELLSFLVNLHIAVSIGTTILSTIFFTTFVYPLVALFAGLLGIGMRLLLRRRRLMLATRLFLGMAFLLMPMVALASESSASSPVVTAFQLMTVVMAGLLLGGLGGWLFVILTIAIDGLLIYAEINGRYTVDITRDPVFTWVMQIVTYSAVAAVLYLTNRLIRNSFRRAQEENNKRRIAEEEVRKLNADLEARVHERTAQLEAANKELEAFSYSVSHDLRAPLRSINSFTKIIKDDFSANLDPVGRGFLERVIDSGNKMNQLIEELLGFSLVNRNTINKQTVDVNDLVHAVIDSLVTEAPGRQIEWSVSDLPPLEADPALLRQVFINLIGNAIKYTGRQDRAKIEIGAVRENNQMIYFIRDNGAGFDMKYADKLFGVFQRLHREDEFEGTGIGLAIVQRIIQRHGGRIWAQAEPEKGAAFFFTL